MHLYAGVSRELGSHLSQLELYVRKIPCMDGESVDIVVGLPIESIQLTLKDNTLLERMFSHERFGVVLTVLLSRIYVLLELMYLPSRFITPAIGACGTKVTRRIAELLTKHAWQA